MIHQAMIYEESNELDLSGFFTSVENKIQTDEGKQIESDIRNQYAENRKNALN